MRARLLTSVLRWLAVVLVLRVLVTILANYPDYFPPDFESLFLQGREATFHGLYRAAFYVHIAVSPVVLLNGLFLLSRFSHRRRGLHRILGRVQVIAVLVFVLPSGAVMARHAFGGWPAGASFFALCVATAWCTILGVVHARRRDFARHRRWMIRSYVLICSAVALRLMSGAAGLVGVSDPETAYVLAAWCSWVVPLAVCEIALVSQGALRDPGLRGITPSAYKPSLNPEGVVLQSPGSPASAHPG